MKLSKEIKALAEYHEGQGHDASAKYLRRAVPIIEKHERAKSKRKPKPKPKPKGGASGQRAANQRANRSL